MYFVRSAFHVTTAVCDSRYQVPILPATHLILLRANFRGVRAGAGKRVLLVHTLSAPSLRPRVGSSGAGPEHFPEWMGMGWGRGGVVVASAIQNASLSRHHGRDCYLECQLRKEDVRIWRLTRLVRMYLGPPRFDEHRACSEILM